MCHGNPHQGVPSTTVTASHVTQGRAEYESTIPQCTDEGLDLWEAAVKVNSICRGNYWVVSMDFDAAG